MLFLVADFDPLGARADEVFQRGVQVERVAHLVKVGNRDVGTLAHRAPGAVAGIGRRGVGGCGIGLELAQNELEQGGFAGTVGAQQANLVAAQDGGRKVAHDRLVAESFGDVGEFGHQLATLVAAGHVHVDAAHHLAPSLVFGAQLAQAHNARLRPGAPGFHSFANPHLFLCQQLVGAGVDHRFLRQLLFFLQQVGGKVAGVGQQLPPVQLHNAGRHVVQERAVVGDGDDAALEFDQQAFEPFDRIQVQVVGRLVQQQHIGLRHQRLRQCHAFFGAAGQRVHNRLRVQVQAVQGLRHALFPVPAVQRLDLALHRVQVAVALAILFNKAYNPRQSCAYCYKNSSIRIELRLLGHVGDAGVVLDLQAAVVGLFHPGQNFEHRGLARAVATNQADAFRGFEGKTSVVKQGNVPISQLGVK